MITKQIISIIENQIKLPKNSITKNTNINNIKYWDSLNHATIISLIENYFKITFEIDEMFDFETINDITITVKSKIN